MNVLTPANQLTLLRVLLVPAFVILTVYGHFGWALVVFVVAGLTDLLDGLIARTWSRRTSLGPFAEDSATYSSQSTAAGLITRPREMDNGSLTPARSGCDWAGPLGGLEEFDEVARGIGEQDLTSAGACHHVTAEGESRVA